MPYCGRMEDFMDNIKNSIAEEQLPWLIFSLCEYTYAINSKHITGIAVTPESITPVPSAPEIYRGIVNIRGDVYPVLDMRRLFGYNTLENEYAEFAETIEQHKRAHLEWADELKRSVESNTDFSLAIDPHKCKFGSWYYGFKSNSRSANQLLKRIEEPHTALHNTAELIANERREPDSPEKSRKTDELMQLVFDEYIPQITDIMDEAVRRYKSYYRETMITFSNGESRLAIVVDRVLAVDKIEFVDGRINMDKIFNSPYFRGVARNSRVEGDILIIDEKKIMDKAERDIPESEREL